MTGNIEFYNEINDKFFEVISEKIKLDSFGKVCISQIYNKTTAKVNSELLKEDEGIAGAIYNTVLQVEKMNNSYNSTYSQLKHLLPNCDFNDDELSEFSQEINEKAKEICINLCSQIYNNNTKEDVK